MDLPIDPTQNDASPKELIKNLPSKAARRRVLQAADVSIDVESTDLSEVPEELSQVELRQAASEIRFAGKRRVYYYRIDGLNRVSPDEIVGTEGRVDLEGAYGPEVKTVIREKDRIYIVCGVPDIDSQEHSEGTQTQLAISERSRLTTVAVFKPRTGSLAVRASDEGAAEATVRAVLNHLRVGGSERISFLENGVRSQFEKTCIEAYSTIRVRNTSSEENSKEIIIRSKETSRKAVADIRNDNVVNDLLLRDDTELKTATALISAPTRTVSDETGSPLSPRATVGFTDGYVEFEQFVPESVLISFDDMVRQII